MKKFFTSLLAFVLVFSASIVFSACGKKSSGPASITFEKGVYSCSLIEDSVEFNENLTPEEHEKFIEFVNSTSFDPIADDEHLYDNVIASIANYTEWFYLDIQEKSITTYTVVVDGNEYYQIKIKMGMYDFSNSVLTFAGGETESGTVDYEIVENEDGTLTMTIEEHFVTGFNENTYKITSKRAYTYDVLLTPSTPENPVSVPTPEDVFYKNKTIAKHYKLVSLTCEGIYEDDAEIFEACGIHSEEELINLIKKYANGEIILFTDGTVFYEMNADETVITEAMMNEMIPSSLSGIVDSKIRIAYMYQYRTSESILNTYEIYEYVEGVYDNGEPYSYESDIATYVIDENGNMIVSVLSDGNYVYTLEEVTPTIAE